VVVRRTISRNKFAELVTQLPPCLIGMEACSGAHEWARRFSGFGHSVKLMAPKFVAPYRKSGKNDGNDAEAICEAVTRPSMRFVPVKSVQQQADLGVHRVRQGFIEERTGTLNRIRGLIAEFGHVLPNSPEQLRRGVPAILDALPVRVACAREWRAGTCPFGFFRVETGESSFNVSRVMGHSKSTLVDAVYGHSMASGLSGVAENVTARALGLKPQPRVIEGGNLRSLTKVTGTLSVGRPHEVTWLGQL
jgi:hypothetical protein